MPQRVLSPLGKQLRSVLTNLHRAKCSAHLQNRAGPNGFIRESTTTFRPRHALRASSRRQSSAAAAAVTDDDFVIHFPNPQQSPEESASSHSRTRRQWSSSKQLNRVNEALGLHADDPAELKSTTSTQINLQTHDEHPDLVLQPRRDRNGWILSAAKSKQLTLESILARAMQARSSNSERERGIWVLQEQPVDSEEVAYLKERGYSIDDVRAWDTIISSLDPLQAANALQKRIFERGSRSVPIFVLQNLLRRQYFSARSLRIVYEHAVNIVHFNLNEDNADDIPLRITFSILKHLVRHARDVWPQALEHLPNIFLDHVAQLSPLTTEQIQLITYKLNHAIKLIAMPTAISPIKANYYQEAAIITILRFMAEHPSSLQTNREGYRGVVSLQLRQKKTPADNKWADLKMLSWPPWKEDRTALDSELTPIEHGMSKASQTLQRMRGAGYAPQNWEKVASIYAGWDTDGTPTIQTLVALPPDDSHFRAQTSVWVARITTTRTVQEAWACYLAYEDETLPAKHDQEVYLAILQKLHREESRKRMSDKAKAARNDEYRRPLYPGDTPDVEPLPPSTHLHTYTRTPPPTVAEFYNMLVERGVEVNGYCLAFLVENAASLVQGVAYVVTAMKHHDALRALLIADESRLEQVPMSIFAAFMKLLSRFSKASIVRALPPSLNHERASSSTILMHNQRLNPNHALVYALTLLSQRKPLFLPAWNAIFQALGHSSSLGNIRSVVREVGHHRDSIYDSHTNEEVSEWRGAITAYRLLRRALSLMRDVHLDLDVVGYKALCECTENAVWGAWRIIRQASESREPENKILAERVREALQFLRSKTYQKRLMSEFWILVGTTALTNPSAASDSDPDLPLNDLVEDEQQTHLRTLEIPPAAILHGHIRALGWLCDYDGLLATVRWMVSNESLLAQRREQDRNGDVLMRRAVVACRVFLERSWIPASDEADVVEGEGRVGVILKKMEVPASVDRIEEMRDLVESVEAWGGWADEEEIEVYCRSGRFEAFHSVVD